jgi:hypothetical protein
VESGIFILTQKKQMFLSVKHGKASKNMEKHRTAWKSISGKKNVWWNEMKRLTLHQKIKTHGSLLILGIECVSMFSVIHCAQIDLCLTLIFNIMFRLDVQDG